MIIIRALLMTANAVFLEGFEYMGTTIRRTSLRNSGDKNLQLQGANVWKPDQKYRG